MPQTSIVDCKIQVSLFCGCSEIAPYAAEAVLEYSVVGNVKQHWDAAVLQSPQCSQTHIRLRPLTWLPRWCACVSNSCIPSCCAEMVSISKCLKSCRWLCVMLWHLTMACNIWWCLMTSPFIGTVRHSNMLGWWILVPCNVRALQSRQMMQLMPLINLAGACGPVSFGWASCVHAAAHVFLLNDWTEVEEVWLWFQVTMHCWWSTPADLEGDILDPGKWSLANKDLQRHSKLSIRTLGHSTVLGICWRVTSPRF